MFCHVYVCWTRISFFEWMNERERNEKWRERVIACTNPRRRRLQWLNFSLHLAIVVVRHKNLRSNKNKIVKILRRILWLWNIIIIFIIAVRKNLQFLLPLTDKNLLPKKREVKNELLSDLTNLTNFKPACRLTKKKSWKVKNHHSHKRFYRKNKIKIQCHCDGLLMCR